MITWSKKKRNALKTKPKKKSLRKNSPVLFLRLVAPFSFLGVTSLGEDEEKGTLEVNEQLSQLRREHREIKKTLQEVQKTTAFYQTTFGMADQILTAVKKGHAKSPSFAPEFLQDKQYVQTVRNLCVQAIYSKWNSERKPASLLYIYYYVTRRIQEMINEHKWDPKTWHVPGRKTVDRRTNETADERAWPKEPPCLCIRAGTYCPNPALFDSETKEKILMIADRWSNNKP